MQPIDPIRLILSGITTTGSLDPIVGLGSLDPIVGFDRWIGISGPHRRINSLDWIVAPHLG
jgi:hypothetical protein